MTEALATREKRTPDELILEGRMQANALMRVVKEAGLSKDLGGSKPHLEVEAWQTIGRFNGYLTDIVWTRPVIEGGTKVGYEARAELVRIDDGTHVIGAEASCFFDEEIETRDGRTIKRWDDDYAVKSMAQTRAQSKLGRMAFAWVAVLAGYSGTPAEEMEGVRSKNGRPIVFPFPDDVKGKAPADCDLATLNKYLPTFEKSAADPKNKYAEVNKRLVAAIKDAIAEKMAKVESPAAPSTQPVKAEGTEIQEAPAGELSDTDKGIVRIREHLEAGTVSRARFNMYLHKNWPSTDGMELEKALASLDLLRLQTILAWLSSQGEPSHPQPGLPV
jgi:hypothetical protein